MSYLFLFQSLFAFVGYANGEWRYTMLENKYKTNLKKKILERFPGSMVFHLDPTESQGKPDLLVLYNDRWAALEGKKEEKATHRPNQDYWVDVMDAMSFARFIYPENEEEVLDELSEAFES